ncbi:phosphoribosylformylglycinamidine synthase [Sedimentibacter sp. zth1]|uniref:phosphoribosylformylglycinamidine synthase n=1 Tax=Sedimentibacter sp. zth1 TaxID=2816908 RepID=UPI001A91D89E|nr:phosphoribosylformylglycinamidine synthase [Sedimentibacter sp. zth1]QSX04977.1 phosphoribosylformylglycinamidine synthase [Sedimentibacter sp. zth1]
MSLTVKRVFVEKKIGFDVEAKNLLINLTQNLNLNNIENLRILNRYDVADISEYDFNKSIVSVLSEPNQDIVYIQDEICLNKDEKMFAVEFLPGQYDQRADSAAECIKILTSKETIVKCAKVLIFKGNMTQADLDRIKKYYINPVDSREASTIKPNTLNTNYNDAQDVMRVDGFTNFSDLQLDEYIKSQGFAMSLEDIKLCREYFKTDEKRNPSITELKVIDTYWSDHCRHTTFSTKLENIEFENNNITKEIQNTFEIYKSSRKFVYENRDKDICLMDLATIAAKELRKSGLLNDLEVSDEINACSIIVDAKIDGKSEEWLVMFKNETHNHPTEIEPFGGAATCLGGAIRDPLSGRSYVYQAMRITGCADPRQKFEDTLKGKLPQRKISTEAANGYSSYGNQIGLATGKVVEIYDNDYVAKRMEIGAVIAATPRHNVKREEPITGDVIILLGGRTGRDGCGGATGSSKEHTEESILLCGSEVQKGNAPTERKIQRLFRNAEVSKLIKRCNDFGAGGVSVAIGELADGLEINLDKVTKKYNGLDGTELAISESQERMAVVIDKNDADRFINYAHKENLEANIVAVVTEDRRLKMSWRDDIILDISRDFLDTNGAKQKTNVLVKAVDVSNFESNKIKSLKADNLRDAWIENLHDLNVCCQKGLSEKFDSTIGAATIIMPFGGRTQMSPAEGMVAKLPVLSGNTDTCTIMTHGFDPKLSKLSPYHGALYAVLHSVAKIVAIGGDYTKIRLTLQEYFEKLHNDAEKWGKPFAALLGAFKTQHELQIPAIGGKDSMSGTFNDKNVPPTLVSFAVCTSTIDHIVSSEFKKTNSKVILIKIKKDENYIPDFEDVKNKYTKIHELIKDNKVLSSHTVGYGGVAEAISKMSFGNKIGFTTIKNTIFDSNLYFAPKYGDIILEVENINDIDIPFILLGETISQKKISINNSYNIRIDEMLNEWIKPLNKIYPVKIDVEGKIKDYQYTAGNKVKSNLNITKPRVFIPVFPGTNCEYDTKKAFERAGAIANTFVFNNLTPNDVEYSIKEMAKLINESQIVAFPGGFSAGDEPDGSGKFIATTFRNPYLSDAIMNLLKNRDGLMIGICNGFQALIKLGLVPYGEIKETEENDPTLTYNTIGRHVSTFAMTKVVSNLSPWFNGCSVSDVHNLPLSHGEGRFVANKEWIEKLKANGQIATQYVDKDYNPTYDGLFNPNGSVEAVEGITSPEGRVLGKMGHSERRDVDTYINIPGNKDQKLFESGVKYFK